MKASRSATKQRRQVMAKRRMFVGMDVHKESIDISLAEDGRDGEVRHYGVIPGDLEALAKVVRAVRATDRRLRFVYEAGPCGFGIHRYLTTQGEDCVVVNPSSMPTRSGDRIKTDRRDGHALARLHRAGELTAISIPTADDEALRDLVRAREDAVGLSTQSKHRLKAFLLRQGRRYPGRTGRGKGKLRSASQRRYGSVTPTWRWAPVVDALQALRGVSFVTAVGLVAEIGDIRRFTHPRELMAFLGLVPSEHSSGPSVRRGGITKAGNPPARRLLAEAAWAYQGVPRLGRLMLYWQEALAKPIRDIAWKAQRRLTARFRRLLARRKAKSKVDTAVARELTGLIWAIAREVPAPPA
jgi:transposase